MNKLQGFFEVWKDEWLTELPKSYKPKSNDQS
jgi:hypothetical protein